MRQDRARRAAGAARTFFGEVCSVYLTLLRVMVPALVVVKALNELGATAWVALALSPVMALVGLPDEVAIVWAAAMLVNIYTGMVVFFDVAPQLGLSVAQVTVLGTMILVAHSLPVEGAVAKAAGASWRSTLALRLGGALVLGALLNLAYSASATLQEPARLLWQPAGPADDSLLTWVWAQAQMLALIFVVIALLMLSLRLLRAIGVERWIHAALAPMLRLIGIGIGREAGHVTVIGFTLGISFGAGLLIREARSGVLNRRDMFLTMSFLGLCHSVIEDTLLIVLLGADLSGILWARLVFALAVIAVLARLPMPKQLRDVPSQG
tara:strand:- start:1217 stop:2188 length:972 start_codon:yes stop_codon:yes gene_type:complete